MILQTTAEANLGATGGINVMEDHTKDNQEVEAFAFHRRGRIELQKTLATLHKKQLESHKDIKRKQAKELKKKQDAIREETSWYRRNCPMS